MVRNYPDHIFERIVKPVENVEIADYAYSTLYARCGLVFPGLGCNEPN